MNEIKEESNKFIRYTFIKSEVVYSIDDISKDKVDLKYDEKKKTANDIQYTSLKGAIEAFLTDEKYDSKKDGQVFYAQQEDIVYVGFAHTEEKTVHEHLAMFIKLEIEVMTRMKSFDVTLEEIEEVFKN